MPKLEEQQYTVISFDLRASDLTIFSFQSWEEKVNELKSQPGQYLLAIL